MFDLCFVFWGIFYFCPLSRFLSVPLSLSLSNTHKHKNVHRTFTGTLRVIDANPVDTEISLEVRRQGILDRSGNSAEEDLLKDFTTGACVKLSSYPVGNPYIYIDDAWRPICGHFFWNDNVGCDTICKRSGYNSGTKTSQGNTYSEDAVWVGQCTSNTDLLQCRSEGSLYETHFDRRDCLSGSSIGVTCTCEDALSSDAGT